MKHDELNTQLEKIDNSPAVECSDTSAFFELAFKLNDELNAQTIRVNDLLVANEVLTKMRSRLRRMFDILEDKEVIDGKSMTICEARRWLLECK